MKAKHALLLFVLGYCFDFMGALLKIVHYPTANTTFLMATALKIIGALLFLYKLLTYPKLKDFLNR